ncbi:MAG: serine hydrolase [Rhizobiales bacterium]|nr:serine hydrolase [Hyphomicrobiales bacterium]
MTSAIFKRSDINLGNWRDRPYSTWAFQNVAEFVPSAQVRGARKPEAAPLDLGRFAAVMVKDQADNEVALADFLRGMDSDALVIMRRGEVVAEWYAPHCDPFRPHLIFSISKSVTGLLAGMLEAKGLLSLDRLVSAYIPDALGSAYGDVTVRDLLNMTVSLDFEESYLDTTGGFDRYRRAMLWKPDRADEPTPTMRQFLCSLPKAAHPHGTAHAYRSPNSDMAGLVLEAASGKRYADLLSELLWQPMGAHSDAFITLDRAGSPRSSGGISVTARDLARLGELVRLGGKGIVPAEFVERLWSGGDRGVWAEGSQKLLYPGGSYRAYWYETGTGALAGLGIFGQCVWIDRQSETVAVRLSSQALPVDAGLTQLAIAMMKAVSAA